MRIFGYGRCSTEDQNPSSQLHFLRDCGYDIKDQRFVFEIISGGIPAMKRPEFANLINNKMESGDKLIVAKLDRLGRNNVDVQQTVSALIEKGIHVCCLDLPVHDLTNAEGKLMLQLMSSFAEFEKERNRERTLAGLAASTKKPGRPQAVKTNRRIQSLKAEGRSQGDVAKICGCSIRTVKRHWNKALTKPAETA